MTKGSLTFPKLVHPSIRCVKHEVLASWQRRSTTGLLSFKPLRFSSEKLHRIKYKFRLGSSQEPFIRKHCNNKEFSSLFKPFQSIKLDQ